MEEIKRWRERFTSYHSDHTVALNRAFGYIDYLLGCVGAATTAAPVKQSDETPSDVDHLLYRLAAKDCEHVAAGLSDCTEELPFADWCVICQSRGLIQKYRSEGAR